MTSYRLNWAVKGLNPFLRHHSTLWVQMLATASSTTVALPFIFTLSPSTFSRTSPPRAEHCRAARTHSSYTIRTHTIRTRSKDLHFYTILHHFTQYYILHHYLSLFFSLFPPFFFLFSFFLFFFVTEKSSGLLWGKPAATERRYPSCYFRSLLAQFERTLICMGR